MQLLQAPTMVAHGTDAFTDLQAALDAAAAGAEIRVASGTYTPTAAPDGSTNNRNKAFHFNKNLVLKGSYNPVPNPKISPTQVS